MGFVVHDWSCAVEFTNYGGPTGVLPTIGCLIICPILLKICRKVSTCVRITQYAALWCYHSTCTGEVALQQPQWHLTCTGEVPLPRRSLMAMGEPISIFSRLVVVSKWEFALARAAWCDPSISNSSLVSLPILRSMHVNDKTIIWPKQFLTNKPNWIQGCKRLFSFI